LLKGNKEIKGTLRGFDDFFSIFCLLIIDIVMDDAVEKCNKFT